MRVEEDGHLALHYIDLEERYRENPPKPLRYWHFTYEARMVAWYARHARTHAVFVMPGRLEVLELESEEYKKTGHGYYWCH